MPESYRILHFWHVRLIKDDTYHPNNLGCIVRAVDATSAIAKYNTRMKPDNGPTGEFADYEPTAQFIDIIQDVGEL